VVALRRFVRAVLGTCLLLLASCAEPVTEVRVRDPWQIALETEDGRAILPAGARAAVHRCEARDFEGFPHFCSYGHFVIRDDGTLVVEGRPRLDGTMLRLPARLLTRTTYRGWPRMRPAGVVVFVTPRSNVTSLVTH
jgi:hypothetical protein